MAESRFVTIAALEDVPPGQVRLATHGRLRLALVRIGDQVFALDAACSHSGAPLTKGRVEGFMLSCPLHGSRFDVRSGRPENPPALDRVRCYLARVTDEGIQVEIVE